MNALIQLSQTPNVCNRGTKATCCPGWTRRSGYNGLCIVPICRSSCGDGRCIRPNLCFCNNRQVRPSCDGPGLPGGGGLVPGKDPSGIGPGGIGPGGIGPGNVVGPGQPQQPTRLRRKFDSHAKTPQKTLYGRFSKSRTVEPIVSKIVSLFKTKGLEVDNYDIDELVEEHSQELTTEELMELHCVSKQEVVEKSLSGEEEVTTKQKSSKAMRDMLKAWETVA
ncbi:hypothetical protein AVEN_239852-1 [Araneus ventricosus]|uniref:Uncharacterized protein n=1 Tax=Araneus ventricosus TaxID=182803 RepID=A0A4Y2H4A5_ARAVE|nr:hypothetical protein AVEN_239852-1 [Araneus ventricosus]